MMSAKLPEEAQEGKLDQNRNPPVPRERFFRAETQQEDEHDLTEIQRFYSGCSVFVTGATGFMGKVLVEKLLRSCPDLDMIYILVREKKGRSLEERMDDLLSSPCFDRIKQECPEVHKKIKGILGDVGLEGLGIREEDVILLRQQVAIVFHVAATVRFDEHLKMAILQNVRGTREVLNLSRSFARLKAVVHVSTAYSNCPVNTIAERIYPAPLDTDHAIRLAETHDVTTVDRLLHKLIGEWPNTYTFTKALSEDIVNRYGKGLPVALIRPSVVFITKDEPVKGWIDNYYGPSGALAACAAGLLRTTLTDKHCEANLVPCDMAISAILVSAWDVAQNRTQSETTVYNYVCPRYNHINWQRIFDLFRGCGDIYPPYQTLWYSTMTLCKNRQLYLFIRLFLHVLPALFMDFALLVSHRKPMMVKVYSKLHRFVDVISYFCTQQWDFELDHVEEMWNRVRQDDRDLFFFNMDALDWERYIIGSCSGIRTYLLKDPPDTLPKARKQWRRMYIIHCTVKGVAVFCMLWVLHLLVPHITAGLSELKEGLVSSLM